MYLYVWAISSQTHLAYTVHYTGLCQCVNLCMQEDSSRSGELKNCSSTSSRSRIDFVHRVTFTPMPSHLCSVCWISVRRCKTVHRNLPIVFSGCSTLRCLVHWFDPRDCHCCSRHAATTRIKSVLSLICKSAKECGNALHCMQHYAISVQCHTIYGLPNRSVAIEHHIALSH